MTTKHPDAVPPTVLHVSQPTTDGVARYVTELVRDQVARGWTVHVATPADATLEGEIAGAGAIHHRWPARRAPGLSTVLEVRGLAGIVRVVRPDVLHLHSSKAGLAGRLAVRGRRPTIFTPHAWSFLYGGGPTRQAARWWERRAARWTTLVLCVSDAERLDGEANRIRAPFTVVHNGVDLERFAPADDEARAAARAAFECPLDAPVVVCAGRLTHQKGQDLLLGAWPTVRRELPDARLLLAGDGPDADRLRADAGTDRGVAFVGRVPDVRVVYAAADIVVAPSRWEGLSFAVLEGLACGRGVVATDVEGMREAIGDGTDAGGVLVAPGDPVALAAALVGVLRDRGRAEVLGARARERAAAFALPRSTAAVAELTSGLVS